MRATQDQIRELGRAIYEERSRLAALPEVAAVGSGTSERQRRIAELDLAARFNGFALS